MRRVFWHLALLPFLFASLRSLFPLSEENAVGIRFVDTATEAGIRAQLRCGGPEKKWIPEANGSGAAWLDYDNDGWLDLLIVNGSTIEQLSKIVSGKAPGSPHGGIYLYKNLRDGRFQDVTSEAGLANPYWGTGANAADYNNDGYTDILVTTIGVDLLYKNNSDGTFSGVGKSAGLSQKIAWHTGSAFGDYDNDGDLDLYVVGYVDAQSLPLDATPPVCQYRGLAVFCGPRDLKGERDLLYRNNGNGTFAEVTQEVGVNDSHAYYGFSAVFDDFNQDGKVDIFVANDSCPNYLYLNLGNGTFKEAGLTSGVALNVDGQVQANMGVAVGDYDNDGDIDLLTTTFSEDHFPLFEQQRSGFFEDVSFRVGLGTTTIPYLGWGCGFPDFDNDGDRDLWLANGHVYPTADMLSSTSYFQPLAVFENQGGKFSFVQSASPVPKNSYRGGCAGDFNNDGKIDLVVLPISGSPLLLANQTKTQHSWIGFKLRGRQSNLDGIGAQVRIEHCGQSQFDTSRNGGSYLSHNDPRLHFGLRSCTKLERVVITWPGGRVQELKDIKANQYVTVQEPSY
jgi:enediyne biosynthesis protein E4